MRGYYSIIEYYMPPLVLPPGYAAPRAAAVIVAVAAPRAAAVIVAVHAARRFFIFSAIIAGSLLSILHNVKPQFYVIICAIVTKMQNFRKNTVIFLF